MAQNGPSAHIRGQALSALARTASPDVAKAAIQEAIAKDPDNGVKRRAVSALGQIPRNEGVPLLLQFARSPANPTVQKEAMRVLGRSKDERAIRFFQDVL